MNAYVAGLTSGAVVAVITWFLSYRSNQQQWRADAQEPVFAKFLQIAERMMRDLQILLKDNDVEGSGRTELLSRLDRSLDDLELSRCSIDTLSELVFRNEAHAMKTSLVSAIDSIDIQGALDKYLNEFQNHRATFVEAARKYFKVDDRHFVRFVLSRFKRQHPNGRADRKTV